MLRIVAAIAVSVGLLCLSAGAKPAALPRDGEFFNTAFLAKLSKTRSLHKSWEGMGPQTITVSREKRGLVLGLNWNWHEGSNTVFTGGKLFMDGAGEDNQSAFFPVDETHFRYKEMGKTHTYRYVAQRNFIADALLVGTYADARGRRYSFGQDGTARFPDQSFRYAIYTDMVFEPCDEFQDLDAPKRGFPPTTGFEWRGSKLYLYSLDCDARAAGCIIEKKPPIAVLRRTAGVRRQSHSRTQQR